MRKLVFLSLLVLLMLLSCGEKEEKIIRESGGVLIIGTTDLPSIISPLQPSVFGSNEILDLLFLRLHRIDPVTGKMKPELASSWEFSEDLKSITYYLRRDVRWWDGQPVTAEDIFYTYQKMVDPATKYPNTYSLRFITNVEVMAPYTIKFTFGKVYADILTDSDVMPISKNIYEKMDAGFGESPVGNGPYKIKEWIPGVGIILTANEDYYHGRPPLDEIHLKYYTNMDDMITDFANGNLDIVLNITPKGAKRLEANKNINIYSKPGNVYTYIGWNLRHPFLQDKKIREALSMAINKKKILDVVFSGMGEISLGPLTPSSWGYDKDIKPTAYDLANARSILTENGFEDFNRNNILDKDRRDFVLTIITNVENPDRIEMLRLMAEDLRALGIRVNTRTMSVESFINAIVNGNFDGFIMGWSVGEKIDPTAYWHSDGKYNLIFYKNEIIDSLIDVGVAMLNRNKAKIIWGEFQKIIYNDHPYTFLIVPDDIAANYKRIRGSEKEIRLASVNEYWIPHAERRVTLAKDLTIEPATPKTTPEIVEEVVRSTEIVTPPKIVTPEKLLEAAVQKDTSTVVTTEMDTVPITPPEPLKPSVITRVEPIKRVEPKYPEAAVAFGASGAIVIRVLVGTDGKVKEATILQSFGNPACEQAALTAARQWEFKPATKDGVPFEQRVSIPFNFAP